MVDSNLKFTHTSSLTLTRTTFIQHDVALTSSILAFLIVLEPTVKLLNTAPASRLSGRVHSLA